MNSHNTQIIAVLLITLCNLHKLNCLSLSLFHTHTLSFSTLTTLTKHVYHTSMILSGQIAIQHDVLRCLFVFISTSTTTQPFSSITFPWMFISSFKIYFLHMLPRYLFLSLKDRSISTYSHSNSRFYFSSS